MDMQAEPSLWLLLGYLLAYFNRSGEDVDLWMERPCWATTSGQDVL